jgi:malate dehydrogenase (oxaloacetate-decarboxylating)(NADP+)
MLYDEALEYHRRPPPGKVAISITKPFATQHDMALAYTPGVAVPVLEIARDPEESFTTTARGNLVAVITNGSAVLGLGDVGAAAAKPVMEGKAALFKRFADVDVFDLEVDTADPEEFIRIVAALEPTFGGINLEDLKAPECFVIEERLRELCDIPVLHDDQHGTAIIIGAALLNAFEVVGKKIDQVRLVISGAGAAALACAGFLVQLGMSPAQIVMSDVGGVVHRGRTAGMNAYMERFAADTDARTLAEALAGADVFIGLSVGGIVSPAMIEAMADHPVIFALANPEPEIGYEEARAARPDAVLATGRSDYPNQVNNVLGFPFIFRGALDVRARAINEEMKVAAARALSDLAKEEVPAAVLRAYGVGSLSFGPDYLIPKPLDPRVPLWVAPAVAEAAMRSGVARTAVAPSEYREALARRFVRGREFMRFTIARARRSPRRIVFSEGEEPRIVRAAHAIAREGIGHPVLLGREEAVRGLMAEMHVDGVEVVDPCASPHHDEYAEALYQARQRKGIARREAAGLVVQPNYFGTMMVRAGHADAFVAGLTYHYPDVIRPALQVVGRAPGVSRVATVHVMLLGGRPYVLTDTMVNIDPSAAELAEIAILAAGRARALDITPRIAMLSFSNFGSTRHPRTEKVAEAVALVKARRPDLAVDGELMADFAVVGELREAEYPFAAFEGAANVLVFPSLEAANTAYKLLQHLGGATTIGPILTGMAAPVHVLAQGAEVADIVNIAAIAVVDAQNVGS